MNLKQKFYYSKIPFINIYSHNLAYKKQNNRFLFQNKNADWEHFISIHVK